MYKPTQYIAVRSGNTFSLLCSYTDELGIPLNILNSQISAEVRDSSKNLITTLDIAIESDSTFRLSSVITLPEGIYFTDIKIVEDGIVRNSDILRINVSDVVTKN